MLKIIKKGKDIKLPTSHIPSYIFMLVGNSAHHVSEEILHCWKVTKNAKQNYQEFEIIHILK